MSDTFKMGKKWRSSLWRQKCARLECENEVLRAAIADYLMVEGETHAARHALSELLASAPT